MREAVIDRTVSASSNGTRARVRSHAVPIAMPHRKRTMPVVLAVERKIPGISRRETSLYTKRPRKSATNAATAPASVAVKMPPRMPPTMMTGMESASPAPLNVSQTRAPEKRRSARREAMFRFFVMKYVVIISDSPTRIPGMIPPRKIFAMEVFVTMPNRMNGMLGGMMIPMTAADAVMAPASAGG